tara:strand:- start:228 stop:1352 length:1125 start_codon:yes stop_codon:yes gene_type:complete
MIKKNILLVASSALPYHIDKLVSFQGKANMLTFASYQEPYVEIQKSQLSTHQDLEVLFENKTLDHIPKIAKRVKVFLSLISRKEKYIFIGIGGAIRAYNLEIFLSMIFLKCLRKKVYIAFDTNFADRQRSALIELIKTFFLLPYNGAICSGPSSASYIEFLGFKKRPIVGFGFNTADLARYDKKKRVDSELKRNLLFIGRMSKKKNIEFLINVYAEYKSKLGEKALPLRLIGSGPNLEIYKNMALDLNLENVSFLGTRNDKEIANELANARALLVPSLYEEWGIVVNEASALSVPVLVSEHVRAREVLVKQFVNGLILEPDNHLGWLKALIMITEDEDLYRNLSNPNKDLRKLADIKSYQEAIQILIGSEALNK